MGTSICFLVILLPSILGQCTIEKARYKFSRSINDFSLDLVIRLAENSENHFVSSPLSLWTLLSSAALGAQDETALQLTKVLHHPYQKCFRNRYFEILAGITKENDGTILEKSSMVFIDNTISIRREFQERLEKKALARVVILPFVNFESVAATINNYVSAATHHAIPEIVSASDLEGVVMILVDAIYFKGRWMLPFKPEYTRQEPFYDEKGTVAGQVSMMAAMHTLKYSAVDQVKSKVLELPYGNGNRFSMLIFLPYTDTPVATVTSLLKKATLKSIFDVISQYPADTVQVHLPRFKMSSELDNLKELLMDMGLTRIFDSGSAQFSLISDYDLYVSNVVQKADIEVTEEGTVAAAASEAEMFARTLPDQFKANKPFLFMIVDKINYIPLFVGAYSKPSVY